MPALTELHPQSIFLHAQMAVDIESEEGRIIRQLIPLNKLPFPHFQKLCPELAVETVETGQILFKRGDESSDFVYLLNGTVTLQLDALKIETIQSGSNAAKFALAHQIPRKVNAVANTRAQILRLNADMMNAALNTPYEEGESYMVVEESEEHDDDWMTTLLKSPIFRVLPPANLQKILISLEEIEFKQGDVIISQGDPGDYYYVIKKGQCLLSRKPAPNAKEIKLGQLAAQDSFGEDSLISGEPRNVTITALTDISLLRLSKQNFIELIKKPSLKYIGYQEAMDYVHKGADLIDVRAPDNYRQNHLPHSINIPFFSLRMQAKTLNRAHPIIVVCQNGKTSEAAAFVLLRHKFTALILEGGIDAVDKQFLSNPASFAIDDGVETGNFTEAVSDIHLDKAAPAAVTAENRPIDDDPAVMRQMIQALQAKCAKLEAEKQDIQQRYSQLFKQTEKLKAVLDTVRGAAGKAE